MSTFSWVYKPYTFWNPLPPKKSTHLNFLSAKNPHEDNINQAKKLKVYGKDVDFHNPPPKVYGFYTCENVDIYGWILNRFWQLFGDKYDLIFLPTKSAGVCLFHQ